MSDSSAGLISSPLAIDVAHLRKSFGDLVAVQDFSLQVEEGEVFGLLGPNGSGKTTTIRMLCGLLIPDAGEGTCLGYNILTESYQIKRNMGYMTQKFGLHTDLTGYENLQFIADLYEVPHPKVRIEETLAQLRFPHHRAQQLVGNLSGGWKQRLALAAAIVHKPRLLLLDEPTAGVDPKARREFWDEIYRLSLQKITTLVSTHYMDEAERCNRLVYLRYGRLLFHGRIEECIAYANLTTFEIKGKGLAELALQLKTLAEVNQVATFGQSLHVSGFDEAILEQAIRPYLSPSFSLVKIPTALEDVFISFMEQEEA